MPVARRRAHPLGKLREQMLRAVVEDRMHGVQPQAVEVELLDPVEGVVDHEFAHRAAVRPVEIDCRSPRRLMPVGKGLRCDRVNVGALGAEMVVDDVEQHHQPAVMGSFDQSLQVLGPPIGRIRGVRQHPVVAPVPAAGKITDRHDLDRGHAKRNQMIELGNRSTERALGRKGADVQLVDDSFLPGPAAPARAAPSVGDGIDHLARPVHVFRLIARGRVWHAKAIRQDEAISRTGAGAIGEELVPALGDRSHGDSLAVQLDLNLPVRRRPEAEAHAAVGLQLGAERHAVRARYRRCLIIEQRQDTAQRDDDPVRPIGELVGDFVEPLFEHKEPHDPIGIGPFLRAETAATRRLEIGIEEGLRRLRLPRREPALNGVPFRLGQILRQCAARRCSGVGEGAEHPGDIPQRGVLCAALRQWTQRLALEVNYDGVPAGR